MRLVCFADTHQFHDELVVPDGDVVISAGDVGRRGSTDEIEGFLRWFSALPHRHKLFTPGNHDGCLQRDAAAIRAAFPDVTVLIDAGVVIDGISFWGAPWTPTFHDWAFMLPRGPALAARWALIPDGTDVLITHGPPRRILEDVSSHRGGDLVDALGGLDDDERFVGCDDLRERVRAVRPRVHLFGHIHTRRGVVVDEGTTFVNCTTWECEQPPTVIDIDGVDVGVRVR
jgi:hypothetical protein